VLFCTFVEVLLVFIFGDFQFLYKLFVLEVEETQEVAGLLYFGFLALQFLLLLFVQRP
jgi:hypothetical protein